MITVICNDCGAVWDDPVILGGTKCPDCGGTNISVAVESDKDGQMGEW